MTMTSRSNTAFIDSSLRPSSCCLLTLYLGRCKVVIYGEYSLDKGFITYLHTNLGDILIRAIKTGNAYLILLSELDEWLKRQKPKE